MKFITTNIFSKKRFRKRDFDSYLETEEFINDNSELDSYYNFLNKNVDEIIGGYEINNKFLLRGDVQSGKTNNIIFLMNQLIENKGVRLILYCTGRLNDLNVQNLTRIRNAFSVMDKSVEVFNAKGNNANYENIGKLLEKNDAIIISGIKRTEFIESFSLAAKTLEIRNPIFIDDESDDVSLSQKFHRTVNEFIKTNESAKYIQITATPYKNLYNFQDFYDLYKSFESPVSYTGLDSFRKNYKQLSDISDSTRFFGPLLHFTTTVLSQKLNRAEMLVSISDSNRMQREAQKMLMSNIKLLKSYITSRDTKICNGIKKRGVEPSSVFGLLTKLYASIFIYNADGKNSDEAYRQKMVDTKIKITVGGIALSRGITFKDLITQVIVKKTDYNGFNAADIMQRSRWFGHRKLIDNIAIYMNKELMSAYGQMTNFDDMVAKFKLTSNFRKEFEELKLENIAYPIYGKEENGV